MSGDRRDLSIRPLGIGETLDRAAALHRRHFSALFLATLALEAPLFLLARTQLARAGDLLLLAAPGADRQRALGTLVAPMIGTLLLLLLGQLLLSAAAAWIVAPSATGAESPRAGAPRRLAAALTASAASLIAFLSFPAVGAAPGALLAWRAAAPTTQALGMLAALAGGGLAFLWALLAFLLAAPAAGVEGTGGFRALARSYRLMRRGPAARLRDRPGLRASIVLLASFAITAAANAAAALPRGVAIALLGPAPGGRLPLGPEVLVSAFELMGVAALRPFGLVALAVLYFDRLARREGVDLEQWALGLAPAREVP
jgi:hypothetical protein